MRAEAKARLPITTERLLLRAFEPADLDALAVMHADPELMRYIPRGTRSAEQTIAVMSRKLADPDDPDLPIAPVLKASGEIIGEFTLRFDGEVELGALLTRDMQGRGLAGEAASALLGLAFGLGAGRVIVRTDPRNAGSVAWVERLGARRLGLRDGEVVYAIEASGGV